MQKLINDNWVDITEADLVAGDIYRISVGGGWQQQSYTPEVITPLLPVVIDNVTNTLSDFDDSDNEFTVQENTNCIASGKLAIPAQNFRVPFVRADTGRKAYMVASVDAVGDFTITLNFKTGGEWVVNTELLNSELPQPVFSIAEHKFKVV